jgi:hypothetical protein
MMPSIDTLMDAAAAKQFITENMYFYSHPSGTARSGRGENSPVASDLMVKGFQNLRISDASVFGKSVIGRGIIFEMVNLSWYHYAQAVRDIRITMALSES